MREFKPPSSPRKEQGRISIFIGGSIEMGTALDWQRELARHLAAKPYADKLDLYNPRRDDWNPVWLNDAADPNFKGQVDWDLTYQKKADLIIYYFAGETISPITLFELGLFYSQNPVIGADPNYKRLSNLLITQDHFPMQINVGWDEFIARLDEQLDHMTRTIKPKQDPMPQPIEP